MRNVYLVLILCCLVSCNHKTEEGKSLMVTHESIQLKNDYLGKPGPIIELDKKIVGIDYALDSCLFYIDMEYNIWIRTVSAYLTFKPENTPKFR